MSSHGPTSQPDSQIQASPTTSDTSKANSKVSLGNKVITTTIESQAGGCLRGDSIPIKVNISHTKHVKSLYGIIVTLYRHARVDMRPAIPLGPTEKGKNPRFEDYYPKSVTGLGGLSLSGAGSTHVFRKDLSQVMVPLMIDPQALETEINAKVRVPEEAFPTISTVPGAMISFKYYVEVVVDIQGKLSSQDRGLITLGGTAPAGHYLNVDTSDMERSAFTPFGSTIVDTASVRRDKSVVTCTFEVIIGTRDSERRKGKRKLEAASEPEQPHAQPESQPQPSQPLEQAADGHVGIPSYDPNGYYDHRWYESPHPYHYPDSEHYHYYHPSYQDQSYHQPPPLPLPQIADESEMSEKERIQRAEQRLLPSQPPAINGQHDDSTVGATAPYLPDEGTNGSMPDVWPSVPAYEAASSSSVSADLNAQATSSAIRREATTIPDYESRESESSVQAVLVAGDDKQEMQRQQLQAAASAPPVGEDDEAGPSLTERQHEAPSAPMLAEADGIQHDVNDSHADAAGSSGLPRYER